MKIAISTNTYHGFSFEEAMQGICRTDVANIELLAVRGWTEHVLPDYAEERIAAIESAVKSAGKNVVALDGHAAMLEDDGFAALKQGVALAERFGAEWFVCELQQDCPKEDAARYQLMLARVTELAAECEKRGMKLAFETRGETYNTAGRIAEVIKETGVKNAFANYDPANIIFFTGEDPYIDLEKNAEYVGIVHLKDQIGGKGVWNFPALGTGEVDAARILRALKDETVVSLDVEFTEKGVSDVNIVHDALLASCEYLHKLGY